MRTHTAMHALCGVVWDRFQSPVTGGNMQPGEGRLDFEIRDWDRERDLEPIEEELNRQLAAARPVGDLVPAPRGGRPRPEPDPHEGLAAA